MPPDEPKSQRKEYVVKGNESIVIKPVNQTGDIRLECDLVGYRKIIQTVNFKDPPATAAGKILEVGGSGDFFSINGAKEGAAPLKAWGGKKPIYDKLHTQASANARVEVEVIDE